MKKKINSFTIALHAMFMALTIIFVFVPIPGFVATAALMLLPTLIMAQIKGIRDGLIQSLILGILLFIKGFVPVTPTDIVLENPLISIFPRIVVALVVGLISKYGMNLINRYDTKDDRKRKIAKISFEYILATINGFIGSLLNAALVLGMFYAFYSNPNKYSSVFPSDFIKTFGNAYKFISFVFISVSIFEVIFTLFVSPPIVLASRKALMRIKSRRG